MPRRGLAGILLRPRTTETAPAVTEASHLPKHLPLDHCVLGSSAHLPTSLDCSAQTDRDASVGGPTSSLTARLARALAMASSPSLGCIRPRSVLRDSLSKDYAVWTTQARPVVWTAELAGGSRDSLAARRSLVYSSPPKSRASLEPMRECPRV